MKTYYVTPNGLDLGWMTLHKRKDCQHLRGVEPVVVKNKARANLVCKVCGNQEP